MRKEFGFILFIIFILAMVFAGDTNQNPSSAPGLKDCIFRSFFVSVSIALCIVILLYFAGYILNFQQLILISKSQASEILITILILAAFVSLEQDISTYLSDLTDKLNFFSLPNDLKGKTIQERADKILNATLNNLTAVIDNSRNYFDSAMAESSKTSFVNLLNSGYGYSLCSTYSVIRGPASLFLNSLATGSIAVVVAKLILSFSTSFSICYLIPLGLLLRMLNFTRKVGSLLLALTISFYLVFPTSIVWFSELFYNYSTDGKGQAFAVANNSIKFFSNTINCDPDPSNGDDIRNGAVNAISSLQSNISNLVKFIVIQILFILFLSLAITLAFANSLSSVLGLEIDLNVLARLS